MTIDIQIIKDLRALTGAGMVEAKKVLEEANGSIEKAVELLRARGLQIAAKKGNRATGEGYIGSYIHSNGKVGALVELLCETDFVARTDDFRAIAKDLALHVAAVQPIYRCPADVPADVLGKEKEIYRQQIAGEGKPVAIVEKIIEGKLNKFYDDYCLVRQKFVKDETLTIDQLIQGAIQKIGENIELGKFVRFEI